MRSTSRWIPITLAVVLIAAIELASDSFLDPVLPFPFDTLLVTAVVVVVAVAAARTAFASIDRLTATVHARNDQLEARNATARALHQVTVAIAALGDLDRILAATVDHARSLLAADAALLVLTEADARPVVRARSGPTDAFEVEASPVRGSTTSRLDQLIRPGYRRAILEAPLQHGGRTVGSLLVGSTSERTYGVDDLETLGSLAGQAAIAIEQDRLQRQLRELAVRRERERIARELHDGVAQVLGYVNTKSQAVEELLQSGRGGEARAQLADLAAAARSVYVDVRTAIRALASPIVGDEPLEAALSRVAAGFADSSKIAVRLDVSDAGRAADVAPAVAGEIAAIVREALTNVQKHAAAARVEVRVDVSDAVLVVEVADDGRGFDPAAPGGPEDWPQYGRIAMSERAGALGGRVAWETAPGAGTVVRLSVPLGPPAAVTAEAR